MNATQFNTGDSIGRLKAGGLVVHIGVVFSPDLVFHNTPENGEHLSSLAEFAAGQPVRLIGRAADARESLTTRARITQMLGRPQSWSLTANNCEHSATRALGQPVRSTQLATWTIISFGIAAVTTATARRHVGRVR